MNAASWAPAFDKAVAWARRTSRGASRATVDSGRALAAGDRSDTRPLVELAKQRYRDLLRAEPQEWDARYNLERALWLAPELEPPPPEDELPPEAKERTISTLPGARLDLP